jgi:HEAT repeat protein
MASAISDLLAIPPAEVVEARVRAAIATASLVVDPGNAEAAEVLAELLGSPSVQVRSYAAIGVKLAFRENIVGKAMSILRRAVSRSCRGFLFWYLLPVITSIDEGRALKSLKRALNSSSKSTAREAALWIVHKVCNTEALGQVL